MESMSFCYLRRERSGWLMYHSANLFTMDLSFDPWESNRSSSLPNWLISINPGENLSCILDSFSLILWIVNWHCIFVPYLSMQPWALMDSWVHNLPFMWPNDGHWGKLKNTYLMIPRALFKCKPLKSRNMNVGCGPNSIYWLWAINVEKGEPT